MAVQRQEKRGGPSRRPGRARGGKGARPSRSASAGGRHQRKAQGALRLVFRSRSRDGTMGTEERGYEGPRNERLPAAGRTRSPASRSGRRFPATIPRPQRFLRWLFVSQGFRVVHRTPGAASPPGRGGTRPFMAYAIEGGFHTVHICNKCLGPIGRIRRRETCPVLSGGLG